MSLSIIFSFLRSYLNFIFLLKRISILNLGMLLQIAFHKILWALIAMSHIAIEEDKDEMLRVSLLKEDGVCLI